MANNFHDVGGILMMGMDLHFGLLLPGVPPAPFIPLPAPRLPHLNLLHPFSMGGDQKPSVQLNGRNAVAHWHSPKFLWPHLSLPPFPIDILTPVDIAFGEQIAWLPRSSVFFEGSMSTCTNIYGPISCNLDCWDVANIPSSLIVQTGTVQTSPTWADYALGLVHVAIDVAINVVLNRIADIGAARVAPLARRARDATRRAYRNVVGAATEGGERHTTRAIGDLFRDANGDLLPDARLPLPQGLTDLAASAGDGPLERSARLDVIHDYLRRHGLGDKFDDFATGIDLSAPVRIGQIPPPDTLSQFVRTGDALHPGWGSPGNWFDPIGGQTGNQVGLNAHPDFRTPFDFEVPASSYEVLETTAAPVVDFWTGPPTYTDGGGTQILVGNDLVQDIADHNPIYRPVDAIEDGARVVIKRGAENATPDLAELF